MSSTIKHLIIMNKSVKLRSLDRVWIRTMNKLNESEIFPRNYGMNETINPSHTREENES